MDDKKTTDSVDAVEVAALAKIAELSNDMDKIIADIGLIKKEQHEIAEDGKNTFRKTAETIRDATIDLEKADQEASDEFDNLTLQFVADSSKADEEDEAEQAAEEAEEE